VNRPSLLQIVERLEGLAGRLPSRIRKAVLSELTPLKQLFLQQRPPRFLFTGSSRIPLTRIIHALFAPGEFTHTRDLPLRVCRWQNVSLPERGTISILDARDAGDSAPIQVQDELKFQSADVIFFLEEEQTAPELEKEKFDELITYLVRNNASAGDAKIIGIIAPPTGQPIVSDATDIVVTRLKSALRSSPMLHEHVLEVLSLSLARGAEPVEVQSREAQKLMSILARELPNQARMEMIRISQDREAQREVVQTLIKSTTAICAAIGTQPIPLADLPILTSLQLMMVAGIMYVSGRERSLRAAAEFIGALGANVGAAMLLREGTRAILKFVPGWGNIVCGLVAGTGTYAIGRAATVFFIEGVSLPDARRIYLAGRKMRALPVPPARERINKAHAKTD
jgi:uncharacterized protein (DUF697 family)